MRAIPATLMRGGSSKGLYFAASDLPADRATRDAVLLAAMGSPDVRQIDGLGGAHPLTSNKANSGAAQGRAFARRPRVGGGRFCPISDRIMACRRFWQKPMSCTPDPN